MTAPQEQAPVLAAVAALPALGDLTRWRLKLTIAAAPKAVATRATIAAPIPPLALGGDRPKEINGLAAALEAFEHEEKDAP